jgi:RHS repeat-associated protein
MYDDTTASNGTTYYYVVRAVNSVGESVDSNEVSVTPAGLPSGSTGVADGVTVTTSATNAWWVGLQFETGSIVTPTVTSLGRWVVAGNSRMHTVSLVRVSDKAVLGSVVVDTLGAPVGKFTYANLASPITLAPNTRYAVLSQETYGLDYYAYGSMTSSPVVSIIGCVTTVDLTTWSTNSNTSYPVDFQYVQSAASSIPSAPTGLKGNAGDGKSLLSWTPVGGLKGYNVYRAPSSGGAYTKINSGDPVIVPAFDDTSVANGTNYYYVVRAVNSAGESADSNEVVVTPAAPFISATPVVSGLTPTSASPPFYGWLGLQVHTAAGTTPTVTALGRYVVAGNTRMHTLSLMRASDKAVLATATLDTLGATAGAFVYGNLATPVTLAANTYYYVVSYEPYGTESFQLGTPSYGSAITVSGNVWSTNFTSWSTTTSPSYGVNLLYTLPPTAPTGLIATGGNQAVTLNWTGTSAGATYNVYRGTSIGGEGVTPINAQAVTTATYTDTGLANSTQYWYKVKAVNPSGAGAESNEANATTRPQGPADLSAVSRPYFDGATYLGFGHSAVVGLKWTNIPNATSYKIYRSGSPRIELAILASVDASPGSSQFYNDSEVGYLSQYYYAVTAIVGSTETASSNEASVTTISRPPATPTGLAAVSGDRVVDLEWQPVDDTNLWSYMVYRDGIALGATGPGTTNYADHTVTNGAQYYYTVTACSNDSESQESAGAYGMPFETVSAPIIVARPLENGIVIDSASPDGRPGSQLNLRRSGLSFDLFGWSTQYFDWDVSPGTTYAYQGWYVTNFDQAMSPVSPQVTATMGGSPPPPPVVRCKWTGTAANVVLTWQPVPGASSYAVYTNFQGLIKVLPGSTTTLSCDTNDWYRSYQFVSINGDGGGEFSNVVTLLYGIPHPPANLVAVRHSNRIALHWSPLPDYSQYSNAYYNIYRSTIGGGPYEIVGSLNAPSSSFDDASASPAIAYHYVVTNVNSGGVESEFTNEASVSPAPVPTAPTELTVTAGYSSLKLTWNAPADFTGTYNIYRSGSYGGPFEKINANPVAATTYRDLGLGYRVARHYRVTAVVDTSESDPSEPASGTTGAEPTIVLTATPGDSHVTLSWPKVAGAAAYKVYRGTSSGAEAAMPVLTVSAPENGELVSREDTGLTNGQGYVYVVAAVNSDGAEIAYTSEVGATPSVHVPTDITVAAGYSSLKVQWEAPAEFSGSYSIYRSATYSGIFEKINAEPVTGTSYMDLGLGYRVTKYYRITATGASTESSPSDIASGTTGSESTIILTATPGISRVTLSWPKVAGAAAYKVYRGTQSGGQAAMAVWTVAVPATGDQVTKDDTGLTNGLEYFYVVTAVDGDGTELGYTTEASATPCAPVPTDLAVAAGYSSLNLTWNAPDDFTGTYNIYRSGTSGGPFEKINANPVTGPTYRDLELGYRASRYYRVTACVDTSESDPSEIASGTTGSLPTIGLTATPGDAHVTLSWPKLAGAASYKVYRGTLSGGEDETVMIDWSPILGNSTVAATDTGLTNGSAYYYVVVATSSTGSEIAYSQEATATPGIPVPTGLTVAAGYSSLRLSWSAPSAVSDYVVYRSASPSGPFERVSGMIYDGGGSNAGVLRPVVGTTFTDPGLAYRTKWYYRVAAVGVSGEGTPSEVASGTTGSAPSVSLSAVPGDGQAALSWPAVPGAVSYSVYRGTSSGGEDASSIKEITAVEGVSTVTATDTGLTNGSAYYYVVVATSSTGSEIAYSQEESATGLEPTEGAPRELRVTAGFNTLRLSWTPPAGFAAGANCSYRVYRSTSSAGPFELIKGLLYLPDPTTGYQPDYPAWGGPWLYDYYTDGLFTSPLGYRATRYYRVTAITGSHESAPSIVASGTTGSNPRIPLTATPGDGQVEFEWPGYPGATSYKLYRGDSRGDESLMIVRTYDAPPSPQHAVDGSIGAGGTYYYVLVAFDSQDNEIAYSNEVSSSVPLRAPTNLRVTGTTDAVSLAWDAASLASSYTVWRSYDHGGPYTKVSPDALTGTVFSDVPPFDGVEYSYVVTANQGEAVSPYSNEVHASFYKSGAQATPLQGPGQRPGTPTLIVTATTAHSIALKWTPVPLATKYTIHKTTPSGSTDITDVLATAYTDANLATGVSYTYSVKAFNGAVAGDSSYEVTAVAADPVSLSAPVISATLINGGQQSTADWYSITWGSVTNAASYNVLDSRTPESVANTESTSSLIEVPVLVGGTTHPVEITVQAVANWNRGPASNVVSLIPRVVDPAPPILANPNFMAVQTKGRVTLSWDAFDSQGNAAWCDLTRITVGEGAGSRVSHNGVRSHYQDTTLVPGKTYSYSLSGPGIATADLVVTATESDAILDLAAVTNWKGVKLTWTWSSVPTQYRVYHRLLTPTGGSSGADWEYVGIAATSTYIDETTVAGSMYEFNVKATLPSGDTDSNTATAVSGPLPMNFRAGGSARITPESTAISAYLTWHEDPDAAYSIVRGRHTGVYADTVVENYHGFSFLDHPDLADTVYHYQLTATYPDGSTIKSDDTVAYTRSYYDYPQTWVPDGLGGLAGNKKVILSWPEPPAHMNIVKFCVKRRLARLGEFGVVCEVGPATLGYVDNDLSNGVEYEYTISATYENGTDTGNSNIVSATPGASAGQGIAKQHINCGGPIYDSHESPPIVWSADMGYRGGVAGGPAHYPNGGGIIPVSNTVPDPTLYQTYRSGESVKYSIPAFNGSYNLSLYFTTYGHVEHSVNVWVNNVQVLTNQTIGAPATYEFSELSNIYACPVVTVPITVTNMTADIRIEGNSISAIAIESIGAIDGDPPVPPVAAAMPGWISGIPMDTADSDGFGPSSDVAVELPTGNLYVNPGPDLAAYNPVGPSVSYERSFRSDLAAARKSGPGLPIGWDDNFDLKVQPAISSNWSTLRLLYPNTGVDLWEPVVGSDLSPLPDIVTTSGTPYLVTGVPMTPDPVDPSKTRGKWESLTVTYKDQSSNTFTRLPGTVSDPTSSKPDTYWLSSISNILHQTIRINRNETGAVTSVTNDAATPLTLLSITRDADGILTQLSNSDSQAINFTTATFGSPGSTVKTLTGVSQVNSTTVVDTYSYEPSAGGQVRMESKSVTTAPGVNSTASFTYDEHDHVIDWEDANTNHRKYERNPSTNAVTVSVYKASPTGEQVLDHWQAGYDPTKFNVGTGMTNAAGAKTTVERTDTKNPLLPTKVTSPLGFITTAVYDTSGNARGIQDPSGIISYNLYDDSDFKLGRLVETGVADANGVITDCYQPIYYTPTSGNSTQENPTGYSQPKSSSNGLLRTSWSLITREDPSYFVPVPTSYDYDDLGNVVLVLTNGPPDSSGDESYGSFIATLYDYTTGYEGYTRPETLNCPLKVSVFGYRNGAPQDGVLDTFYKYDDHNRVTDVITLKPKDSGTSAQRNHYTYNAANQIVEQATFVDDAKQRVIQRTYLFDGGPLSEVALYDGSGGLLRSATYNRGLEGEVTSVTGSAGTVRYTYDSSYRVRELIDERGNATKYDYDAAGNVQKVTYPGADTNLYEYDAEGRVTRFTDGRGTLTTYTYWPKTAQIKDVLCPTDPTTEAHYTYDSAGRVSSMTDSSGTQAWTYYNTGQAKTYSRSFTSGPQNISLEYTVSHAGYRTQTGISFPSGGGGMWTYYYDSLGRVWREESPSTTFDQQDLQDRYVVFEHSYDDAGRLATTVQSCVFDGGSKGRIGTKYLYNPMDQIISISNGCRDVVADRGEATVGYQWNSLLSDFSMTYDAAGERRSQSVSAQYDDDPTHLITNNLTFDFDVKDQLIAESSILFANSYNYDASGNPSTFRGISLNTAPFNSNNQWAGIDVYDGNGNPTALTDALFEPTKPALAIVYDAANRIVSVNGTSTYTYDASGRRATRTVNGLTTYFLYDGDRLLYELNGAGSPVVEYGWAVDGLRTETSSRRTNEGVSYTWPIAYTYDPEGNVVHKQAFFGPNASPIDTRIYDAYGKLQYYRRADPNDTSTEPQGPVGFGGQYGYYTDTDTGLVLCTHRYYDPLRGRWVTRDPIGYAGGMNLYGFCGNNPVMGADPSGYSKAGDAANLVGLIPGPVGMLANLASAADSFHEHDYLGAMLSLLGEIPALGEIATAAKITRSTGKALKAIRAVRAAEATSHLVANANNVKHVVAESVDVYRAVDEAGKVIYIGITKAYKTRAAAHFAKKGIAIEAIDGLSGLSRADARAVEQTLIELHSLSKNGGTLLNKINSIAATNPKYAQALARGSELLRQAKYEGF